MGVLAICPSRGRPKAAHETLRSFQRTIRDPASRIVFVVDSDDPTRDEYPLAHTKVVPPAGSMGGALAAAVADKALLGDATSVGMVGDDNRFRTRGWDVILDGYLSTTIGVAYGDDGFQHERLPTSWWLSRPIVDALGLADPILKHYYMDNWAMELGKATDSLRYFPDVSIEHLHPLAGKGEEDAIYKRAGRFANADRSAFRVWMQRGLARDAQRIRTIQKRDGKRRVLADWHHPALWESLSILFEDRYGWELYAMAGLDWQRHGWQLQNGTPGWTPADYLCHPAVDRETHLEAIPPEYPTRPRKMVTWQQAQAMSFDYVLASVSEHQRPFSDLALAFGARFVHQVGNARHHVDRSLAQVVLASANVPRLPTRVRVLRYHQEFDRRVFAPSPITDPLSVATFMLRLDTTSCPHEWLSKAKGIRWSAHGGSAPGSKGYLAPMSKVADAMRSAGWIWHDKRIGDGYGHVLHNAAAMGRPFIGHASHFAGQAGAPLWRDLETCIDLDRHPEERALRLLRAIAADPEWMADVSRATVAAFDALVDFDAEAEAIRAVLD